MTGADAGAVVAVKVFVERNQIAPMRVALKFLRAAEDRPPALFVPQENSRQALGDFAGDLPQIQIDSRSSGIFDLEVITEKEVKFLQRLDEQVVDGKPDRTAPVGVPAK